MCRPRWGLGLSSQMLGTKRTWGGRGLTAQAPLSKRAVCAPTCSSFPRGKRLYRLQRGRKRVPGLAQPQSAPDNKLGIGKGKAKEEKGRGAGIPDRRAVTEPLLPPSHLRPPLGAAGRGAREARSTGRAALSAPALPLRALKNPGHAAGALRTVRRPQARSKSLW